jgi:hypothetical protein
MRWLEAVGTIAVVVAGCLVMMAIVTRVIDLLEDIGAKRRNVVGIRRHIVARASCDLQKGALVVLNRDGTVGYLPPPRFPPPSQQGGRGADE